MEFHPKFGFDVETDDTTQAPRGYEKFSYSCSETFWGEQGRLPNRSKTGLKEQGKETSLAFTMTGR